MLKILWCVILSSCNATSESNRNLLWYETHVPIMLMTWIIYYSPHIFSLRSKDQLIRFHVSYPTFLQVLFFRRFHYTALWLGIPLNTRINTDSSTAFIVIIYLQLMDVRAYHLSCVGDTIKVLINVEKHENPFLLKIKRFQNFVNVFFC